MKRKVFLVILSVLISVSFAYASGDQEGGGHVVFHLNHFMPAVHPLNVNMLEPMAAEVKEKTEGRVEIVVHPGNALAAPRRYL